jgi:hydrogenase maturation protease
MADMTGRRGGVTMQAHQNAEQTGGEGRCAVLVGVGNEFSTDDALGVLVAREMRRRCPSGLKVVEASGEGASLIDAWKGADEVIIVDAMAGPEPGEIHRIDASASSVPKDLSLFSSHAFGVADAIEMARELHQLPAVTILYGIEGEAFDPGVGLSDSVLRSLPRLLAMIEQDLCRLKSN